ncbi:MAG TPA: excinuclease ABC subunit UvrC [Firmicutes bacterium]|nr:excinuclease ABC subunit UvrC [Bacillota bacterium]
MALKEDLEAVPAKPGVYLMLDREEKVLYVGKAASLRPRVRSYFQPSAALPPRISRMVEQVARVDFITTSSELEALALESNLIKEYRPKYNVKLRDDKQYPWLKVTMGEDFPRVYIVRRPQKDGSRYFGPYTDAGALREIFRLLRKVFPIRTCKKKLAGGEKAQRPCLNFHIGRCPGPCTGRITPETYRDTVQDLIGFLEGKTEKLSNALKREMEKAAEDQEYEKAAAYRDKLRALERVLARQTVVSVAGERDVLGWARQENDLLIQVLQIRRGRLINKVDFYFVLEDPEEEEEILRRFLLQYYDEQDRIPREILAPFFPGDRGTLVAWLREKSGHAVALLCPKRGEKWQLLRMAGENAAVRLAEEARRRRQEEEGYAEVQGRLQELFALPRPPRRIEGFDVSNFHGDQAVAAMVVFEEGRPRKDAYRRFRIHGVEGINDLAMLEETVRRRFARGLKEREESGGLHTAVPGGTAGTEKEKESGFAEFPDLLLIDGGKNQVQAVLRALTGLGLADQPLVGLAEENEELFLPGCGEPIRLPAEDRALRLLEYIRDEAHRFAVTYHRTLRQKKLTGSALDRIKGIGPRRKKALLTRFGSIRKIKEAGLEELMTVEGITEDLARAILEEL